MPIAMYQNNQHLISRLTWDTAFDSKAQGALLQDRLSNWSSFRLQQEIATVFDKFCPAEQTWKIESLELDLGTINYNDLETELGIKLREQLNEKLIALLLYPNQHHRYLEILDEKRSQIQLIGYFLQHGLLPWNYWSTDGSINQILTRQLQNNQEELVVLIKELGFSAEKIRRRMAWQFNEANMLSIIGAIEPNVGGQIIAFSNDLTLIQQKATLVQVASTSDFKKNVWFWILNYLLTEHGTVFNRIQFMKSSIRQMAAHYNLQYDELLEIIEVAVNKLRRSLNLQPDFISTLQLLFKENKAFQKKEFKLSTETEDHWSLLASFFKDQYRRRTVSSGLPFSELVTLLSKQDQLRFRRLLHSFGDRAEFWLPLINDLSDDGLKTIFIALKDNRSVVLTESIFFLNRLMGRGKVKEERNALWFKGLIFLLLDQGTAFKEIDFFETLIVVLAQKQQCTPLVMLDQLLVAEVPTSLKSIRHTPIYQTLVAVFKRTVSNIPSAQFNRHLQQLLTLLHRQANTGVKDRKRFEILKNMLHNYQMLEPKAFQIALANSPYRNSLASIFSIPLGVKTTSVLKLPAPMMPKMVEQGSAAMQSTINQANESEWCSKPLQFLQLLKTQVITEAQWTWLYQVLSFEQLLEMISSLHPPKQDLFNSLNQLYQVLSNISLSGITTVDLQYLLFKKVSKAWVSSNWKLIAAENIWKELIWEVVCKRGLNQTEFISAVAVQKSILPAKLQLTFEALKVQDQLNRVANKVPGSKIKHSKPSTVVPAAQKELFEDNISIKNAGLVLLNGYLSMLLERLSLTDGQRFLNRDSQLAAVHYLQYVVTGQTASEESLLPLNKLLCGLPLVQPVAESIELSSQYQSLIEGLIEAVIGHWPAIGSSSVNGFRGNWLVREGLLIEKEDRWELHVDKRAYDLLINHSPFSFSIIKYPWMDKPLHVNWPY